MALVGKLHFTFLFSVVLVSQVSEVQLPNSRVQLTVTVPPGQCKKSFDSVVKVLQKNVKVPGFRKGSPVPLGVLINAVGGLKALHAEVIKDLVEKTTQEVNSSWLIIFNPQYCCWEVFLSYILFVLWLITAFSTDFVQRHIDGMVIWLLCMANRDMFTTVCL